MAQDAAAFADLAQRAAAARDAGNSALAIDLYGQAVQLKADWAEGWFYVGLLEYGTNQYGGAVQAFHHFLELQPNAPPALALQGLCEFEMGEYDDALGDLELGVEKGAANEPHNEQIILYHYAQLLTRAGRFDDAARQYEFFAKRHIYNPDLLVGLGLAGTRTQALSKDVPAANRAMYEDIGKAGYAFLAGDSDDADRQFKALFARYPSTPDLYLFYGTLLYRHGSAPAIDQFRHEVTAEPGNGYARALLAFTLTLAGRYTEARPEAERAIGQAPDEEMAQIALGRSLIETGSSPNDHARAVTVLDQVIQHDPDSLEAHMALAALYSRTGRREDEYRERQACLHLAK